MTADALRSASSFQRMQDPYAKRSPWPPPDRWEPYTVAQFPDWIFYRYRPSATCVMGGWGYRLPA